MPYGHASMLLLGEESEATEPNKYDKVRPHSIRSLQFDQKIRPLSFRPEKFDLITATQANGFVGDCQAMKSSLRRIFGQTTSGPPTSAPVVKPEPTFVTDCLSEDSGCGEDPESADSRASYGHRMQGDRGMNSRERGRIPDVSTKDVSERTCRRTFRQNKYAETSQAKNICRNVSYDLWGISGVCTLALTVAKTSSHYDCFAIFVPARFLLLFDLA